MAKLAPGRARDLRTVRAHPDPLVILCFAACAVMGAWSVLRDQNFDYRMIALGALLPDILDAPVGHRGLAHTLLFAVGALATVMAATVNRRPLRKRLIALPIGLLAHLVLDFVFTQQRLFWWPAFGVLAQLRRRAGAPRPGGARSDRR